MPTQPLQDAPKPADQAFTSSRAMSMALGPFAAAQQADPREAGSCSAWPASERTTQTGTSQHRWEHVTS